MPLGDFLPALPTHGAYLLGEVKQFIDVPNGPVGRAFGTPALEGWGCITVGVAGIRGSRLLLAPLVLLTYTRDFGGSLQAT